MQNNTLKKSFIILSNPYRFINKGLTNQQIDSLIIPFCVENLLDSKVFSICKRTPKFTEEIVKYLQLENSDDLNILIGKEMTIIRTLKDKFGNRLDGYYIEIGQVQAIKNSHIGYDDTIVTLETLNETIEVCLNRLFFNKEQLKKI
jgi:hypothetical protein